MEPRGVDVHAASLPMLAKVAVNQVPPDLAVLCGVLVEGKRLPEQ